MPTRRSAQARPHHQAKDSTELSQHRWIALGAISCWFLAGLFIASRHYTLVDYQVIDPFAELPLGLGLVTIPLPQLALLVLIGVTFVLGLMRHREPPHQPRAAIGWLAACLIIPLLELARRFGAAIPLTYWEPIGYAIASGMAARDWPLPTARKLEHHRLHILTCLVTTAAVVAWYVFQAEYFFQRFLLGFNDFGQFALRVVNTLQGRGFLRETADLPRFWDHFNPGLAVFVPLWSLTENVHLFFWAQAVSLAVPAVLIYLTARSLGATRLIGSVWSVAFLANPVIKPRHWRPWLVLAVVFFGAFGVVYQWSGMAGFQTNRFGHLGRSPLEIAASPILNPWQFWGEVLSYRSLCFVAILAIPFVGTWPWKRSWWVAAAIVLPLAVLLAWNHGPATSIGFQYSTTLWPFLFLAALCSAAASSQAARYALVASLAASLAFGGHVFSSPTLDDVVMGTYELDSQGQVFDDRAPGGGAHQLLQYWISEIRRSDDSATLATGRVASHFVGADYLETVGQVNLRWKTLSERGDPLLAFRWIVVDTHEWFQQSPDQIQFVLREAKINGFELVADEFGIMVWQRTR